jgi:hypothetical protein
MNLRFVFIGEGSSDNALVEPLEELCLRCGAEEVTGVAPDLRRFSSLNSHRVEDKVQAVLDLEPQADLVFIHRDSDSRDPEPRHQEIRDAVNDLNLSEPHVAVVPVQETEAWLLLDEELLRFAAENPNGSITLDIPSPSQVENISNPKRRLRELLEEASELSGRHLDRFKRRFSEQRRLLTERLEIEGPVSAVPAWERLRNDLGEAFDVMRQSEN